jgi:Ca2+-transporting ATPase
MASREIPGPGPKPTPPHTRRIERLLTWPDLDYWSPGEGLDEPWHALVEMAVLASRGDPVDAMELAIQRLAAEHLRNSEHLHPDWPLEREYPLQANLLVVSRLWRDARGLGRLAAKGGCGCHRRPLPPDAGGSPGPPTGRRSAGRRRAAGAGGGPGPGGHPHDFLFEPVGFLGLADPLRPDVPQAIATAQRAGVRVVMITGNGPVTPRAIADQAGLPPGPVLCGADLPDQAGAAGMALSASALSASALSAAVAAVSVFARVLPQQQLELVRALQAGGVRPWAGGSTPICSEPWLTRSPSICRFPCWPCCRCCCPVSP